MEFLINELQADKNLHEKEVQQKAATRAEAKAKEANEMVVEKKRTMENLESEIDVFKLEVGNLKKAIYQLEKGDRFSSFLNNL